MMVSMKELIKLLKFVECNKSLLDKIQKSKTLYSGSDYYLNLDITYNKTNLRYKDNNNNFLLNVHIRNKLDTMRILNSFGTNYGITYIPGCSTIRIENEAGAIEDIEYSIDEDKQFQYSTLLENWKYEGYNFIHEMALGDVNIEFSFIYQNFIQDMHFDSFYNLFDEILNEQ